MTEALFVMLYNNVIYTYTSQNDLYSAWHAVFNKTGVRCRWEKVLG